jgi:type VI secretion system secreted protein Hcp
MTRTLAVSVLAMGLLLGVAADAAAQVSNTFMFVPGIPGESTDEKHRDWIDILSVSQAWAPDARKDNPCVIHVMKRLDVAGPKLWAAAITGQIFPQIKIEIARAGGDLQTYYEITLTGAFITSVTTTGYDVFAESLSLSAPTVTLSYRRQKPDGSLEPPVTATLQCN